MILGICGSPRKQATEYVLGQALTKLKELGFETEFFTVRGKSIGFCQHCDYCLGNKECRYKDDMSTLYPLLREAEGLVIASPVYNGGVSAQTKAIMDRCRALFAFDKNVLRGTAGAAITVGGDRAGGQELAIQQIITFYVLNGVIPVGGGAFGANLGATFWSKDTLNGVKQDEEGMKTLNRTMKRFDEFLKQNTQGKRQRSSKL
jgi:multimeric flavodoxin WrbA